MTINSSGDTISEQSVPISAAGSEGTGCQQGCLQGGVLSFLFRIDSIRLGPNSFGARIPDCEAPCKNHPVLTQKKRNEVTPYIRRTCDEVSYVPGTGCVWFGITR